MADNRQRYKVPHPDDCTKFYKCQWLGGRKYKPNLKDCQRNEAFDENLMICNDIKNVPRCNKGKTFLFR